MELTKEEKIQMTQNAIKSLLQQQYQTELDKKINCGNTQVEQGCDIKIMQLQKGIIELKKELEELNNA